MLDKTVTRRICGLKKEKIMEGLRKFQNEKLHGVFLCKSHKNDKTRRMRQAGHVACMRQMRYAYENEKKRIVGISVDQVSDVRVTETETAFSSPDHGWIAIHTSVYINLSKSRSADIPIWQSSLTA